MIDRRIRLAWWRKLSPEIILALPADYRAHVFAALAQEARRQFAQSRIEELEALSLKRLTRDQRICLKLMVFALGAFTFSLAPRLLAQQAGGDDFAFSIGLLGGGVACYFTQAAATEVLTDLKFKQNTNQVRSILLSRLSPENSNGEA
ncbi:hypothetical protein LEP3755_39120 [Leptolyngbya sp. NIES-3755]|nr:hypothetical protein LEP3755_39120 [Leptolyngbya sp. NIES-3755]